VKAMAEVVKFRNPKEPPLSLEEYVEKVHELSKDSSKVFFDSPHNQQRMRERKVTMRQVFDVLRSGDGIDGPSLDQYGGWRIKLARYTAGRTVQVVVAIKHGYLEVITVIATG
jgi:HSP90 family molecular chaperone